MRLSYGFVAALAGVTSAQYFITPPDSTDDGSDGNQLQTYTVGDTIDAQWECDWPNIDLILWNDATAADGSEWIMWIMQNQPNDGFYSFILGGNIPLNNGSRFHLEVISVDPDTGEEDQSSLIDSESFNLVAGANTAPATATVTQVVTHVNTAGSTVIDTYTNVATAAGTAASATATGKEKSDASAENGGASSTSGTAQATSVPAGMSESTKVGLGVGLGLGIPLVVAAVGLGWFLLHRQARQASQSNYFYSGLGTATGHQEPLPADPRKVDPYAFEHRGQVPPVEKGNDDKPLSPQELPS